MNSFFSSVCAAARGVLYVSKKDPLANIPSGRKKRVRAPGRSIHGKRGLSLALCFRRGCPALFPCFVFGGGGSYRGVHLIASVWGRGGSKQHQKTL